MNNTWRHRQSSHSPPPALLHPTSHSAVETKSHKGHIISDITGQTHELCEARAMILIHAPNVRGERRKVSGCRWGAHWLTAAQQNLFFMQCVASLPLLPFYLEFIFFFFISWTESRVSWATCSTVPAFSWGPSMSGFKSFPLCPSRCVSPMLLAPEAWGEVSQAQAPMGRPVTQHALLLLQCMLVLRPGSVVSRRGPVLLPESPCYKTEHPLIPHSGMYSEKHMLTCTQKDGWFFFYSAH